MPIMEYIGVNRSIVNDASKKGDPIDKAFMDWKELNIKKRSTIIMSCRTKRSTC